jgi:hypothetical protein
MPATYSAATKTDNITTIRIIDANFFITPPPENDFRQRYSIIKSETGNRIAPKP